MRASTLQSASKAAEGPGDRLANLGGRLRRLRQLKRITLKTVAEAIGVTESMVSQIERGRVSPSLDTLLSITDYLGVDLDYLFRELRRPRRLTILRRKQRRRLTNRGVAYEQLSVLVDSDAEYAFEAVLIELDPGATKASTEYGHPGTEFGFVLAGTGVVEYDHEDHLLRAGDTVSFDAGGPHALRNTGRTRFRALWILSPPKLNYFTED